MRTIAVVNQKGGCGKTITAINLAAFLARAGRRVLLVDMDPQGHATLGLLTASAPPSASVYDVLAPGADGRRASLQDIAYPVRENLDLAPADILLSALPEVLAGVAGREDALATALADLQHDYDYAVVDCPPNVGLLTFNALKACSEAIVPMDPSFFALHGIGKVFETFDLLARKTGHDIAARVLVTLYSGRAAFSKAILEEIHTHLAGRHFATTIRYSIKLAEAASHGVPIADYCRHCAGFEDYAALATEVLQQEAAMGVHGRVATVGHTDRARSAHRPLVPSAPAVTNDGVVFTVAARDAHRVQLAGDFNDWVADGSDMEPMGDVWVKVLKLPPGRYRYRFVVDGQWQRDPLNSVTEPSPFGGDDSLLVLPNAAVQ
jgi:chromosome partitioning protein